MTISAMIQKPKHVLSHRHGSLVLLASAVKVPTAAVTGPPSLQRLHAPLLSMEGSYQGPQLCLHRRTRSQRQNRIIKAAAQSSRGASSSLSELVTLEEVQRAARLRCEVCPG